MPLRRSILICLLASGVFGSAALSSAQDRSNCMKLKGNPKLITDCLEALFSQDPIHLTLSSLPSGNGMAMGIVLDKQRHYLPPFGPPQDAVFDPDPAKRLGKFEPQ